MDCNDMFEQDDHKVVVEPAKDGEDYDATTMVDDTRRKVGFASTVSVMEIPGRLDYSEQVRHSYWADKRETSMMTERNMIEFAAEGWDWKNAADDEHMLIINGEAVHPVHSNPYLCRALQRQIPYPRAVTPPDEQQYLSCGGGGAIVQEYMQYDPTGRGAVTPDAEEMERPSSPFVESVVMDDDMHKNFDEYLLMQDPDQFLRQRFAAPPHHGHRQDIPCGDSDDAYFNQVLSSTNNLRI
jgi:hypothetical protein